MTHVVADRPVSSAHRRRALSPAALLAGAAALATTTLAPGAAAASSATSPKITDAWARTSPAGATMGAAYMVITSPRGDRLISASVPKTVAAKTEIHETVMAGATTMPGRSSTTMTPTTMTPTTMGSMGSGATATTMGAMPGMSGAMTMRPVSGIDLPARTAVALKPGGNHVMLVDLAQPLKVGTSIRMTLRFRTAGAMTIQVPVKEG